MLGGVLRQSSEQRMQMITQGNISKTLWFLSIPGIMMMLIQSLMPIIDSIFIYNFDNPLSGAAITYIASIQNVFVNGAQGVSMAGSAIIGQINGSGDLREGRRISGQLMSVSFLFGLVLIPVLVGSGMAAATATSQSLHDLVFTYNLLYSFSLPLIICSNSFNSVKNVAGHPEKPFIRALMFVPIKLLFTYLYVGVFSMGIVGAALSTFSAYLAISLFIVYDLFLKRGEERILLSDLKVEWRFLKRLFGIAWPAALQNSLKALGFFVLKMDAAAYGEVPLSGFGIGSDVCNLFTSFTNCMDAAITSMVSINMGARRADRARSAAYRAVGINSLVALGMTGLCIALGPAIIGLYTDDAQILAVAVQSNWIISLGILGFAVMFNEMPAFIGLGHTKTSLVVQLLRIWVFRILAYLFLTHVFPELGIASVAISYSFGNLAAGLSSHLLFRRVDWHNAHSLIE